MLALVGQLKIQVARKLFLKHLQLAGPQGPPTADFPRSAGHAIWMLESVDQGKGLVLGVKKQSPISVVFLGFLVFRVLGLRV